MSRSELIRQLNVACLKKLTQVKMPMLELTRAQRQPQGSSVRYGGLFSLAGHVVGEETIRRKDPKMHVCEEKPAINAPITGVCL